MSFARALSPVDKERAISAYRLCVDYVHLTRPGLLRRRRRTRDPKWPEPHIAGTYAGRILPPPDILSSDSFAPSFPTPTLSRQDTKNVRHAAERTKEEG
jgi:hypothetical protein